MKASPIILLPFMLACFAGTALAKENPPKVEKNTVALWIFDQGAGDETKDMADSGIFFAPKLDSQEPHEVPPESVDGRFGKALKFSGSSALIGSPGGVIETPEQVTVEVWLKLDSQSEEVQRGVFEYMAHQKSGYRMIIAASGYLNWLIQDGSQEIPLRSMTKVPVDEWVHLACTYDGTTMKIFINGQLDSEMSLEGANPQGVGKPFVGLISAGGGPYFRGIIEAVRVSKTALTEFPQQ